MKKTILILTGIASTAFLLLSCNGLFQKEDGFIEVFFSDSAAALRTKATSEFPDTNNFILRVYDPSGTTLYNGKFGNAPKAISTPEGNCTVEALSREFTTPLFDAPQYGDRRTVTVSSGRSVSVQLECTLQNCGIKLHTAPEFLEQYPNSSLVLRSADGTLMYSYSEKRTAFFRPGAVSLVLSTGGEDRTLMTRTLEARDILTINVSTSSPSSSKSGISISVDTSAVYSSEDFVIDSGGRGSSKDKALSVYQARESAGLTDVWVYGYIVGGDLSSSKCSFEAPFSSRTNLVLAPKSSCRDRSECISVQLQKGDIREALNLVDHPENLGREVFLLGDIVQAYYGLPGVQAILEYDWKE